jgi:hypothetical protein
MKKKIIVFTFLIIGILLIIIGILFNCNFLQKYEDVNIALVSKYKIYEKNDKLYLTFKYKNNSKHSTLLSKVTLDLYDSVTGDLYLSKVIDVNEIIKSMDTGKVTFNDFDISLDESIKYNFIVEIE